MKTKNKTKPSRFILSVAPVIFFNTLISIVIAFPLFKIGGQSNDFIYLLSDLVTFISHFFSLSLVIGIIIYMLTFMLSRKALAIAGTILFFSMQAILLIDVKIFSIFHYHLNSLVWNLLTTEGVADSVILGKGTILTLFSLLFVVLLAETGINVYFNWYNKKISAEKLAFLAKTYRIAILVGLSMVMADKGIYACADIVNNTEITKNAKLYPLYQPLTVKGFASRQLGINIKREDTFKISKNRTLVNYPKEELVFNSSNDKNHNIIMIVVDGLRFDMLDSEIMPNTWEFGKENIIARNHYSGGNGTRFGIFSLIYGISGTYWHDFLASRVPPVLIDVLIEKGYDFKILSSTKLTFPEFRKTAFLRIPDHIEDKIRAEKSYMKDGNVTDRLLDYISSERSQKPFFAFLLYNSSHGSYKYPPEFEKFRPAFSKEELNYFTDIDVSKVDMIRNRYKNAVHYEDHLVGKILSSLKDNNLLNNTAASGFDR